MKKPSSGLASLKTGDGLIDARRMQRIIRNLTIKSQLLGGLLLVTLLPILMVSAIAYWLIKGSVESSAVLLIQDILSQIGQSLGKEFQDVDNMSIKLYSHPDLLRIIGKDEQITTSEHDEDNAIVLSLLTEMTRSKIGLFIQVFDFIRRADVLKEGVGLFTSYETSTFVQWQPLQKDLLFQRALEKKGKESVLGHLSAESWTFAEQFLVMLRVMNRGQIIPGAIPSQSMVRISKTPIGMILICIREKELRNIYMHSTLVENGDMYLINRDGEVLTSSDERALQPPFLSPISLAHFRQFAEQTRGYQWIEHERTPYLLSFQVVPQKNLILYTLQPKISVMKDFYFLRNGLFLVTGIGVFIAVCVGLLISTSLTRPITALTRSIEYVKQTGYAFENRDVPQKIRGALNGYISANNEIGIMADAFKTMIGELEIAKQHLRDKERLQREMELARHIQTALLPEHVANLHPDFDIAAIMIPAEEVGGDYYDLTFDKEGNLWFGIGDVSGHGVTPGLIMMMAQTIHVTITTNFHVTPREVVIMANKVLYKNLHERLKADHFMTFTTLKYLGGGHFQYAGEHLDLIIHRRAQHVCETLKTEGCWLNFLPDISEYACDAEFDMELGDTLFLYSDGLTEAQSPDAKIFGDARFIESITRHAEAADVTEIRQAILDDVLAWANQRRDDDMTLMVIRRIT